MTRKQWEKLQIGDIVTRTNGPNKNIPCKVKSKYLAIDLNRTPCLSAVPVDPDTTLYVQNTSNRGSNIICGSANCFKVLP